jgi:hypothetical protein
LSVVGAGFRLPHVADEDGMKKITIASLIAAIQTSLIVVRSTKASAIIAKMKTRGG